MKLKSLLVLLPLFLFTGFLPAQSPVGWASQNGGTTGGEGGSTVTVTNRSEFYTYATSPASFIIQVQDTIELNLYEMVPINGNKTIVGLGQTAAIRYGGLRIEGNNVIIRNLEIFDTYDGDWGGTTHSTDGITVYGAQNVWIDHCWLHTCADGLLDIRSNGPDNIGDFVTVSYTRFSDHNKVMLIGSSDNNTYNRGHLRVTLHHCWFDGTLEKGVNQRMPRIRFGDVHVFNNYYEEVDSYCVAANFESDAVIENTYFRNSGDPHTIGNIGQGIENPDLVIFDNVYEYSSGTQATNGTAFTPSDFYTYMPDPTNDIPRIVMNSAGPFNNPDNIAPVAVTDMLELAHPTALVFLEPVTNDTDADGGDLRIASVINEPQGEIGIQTNRILYRPSPTATQNDTLHYELVDTQGGVDTGMVILVNPFITSTKNQYFDEAALVVSPNPVSEQAIIEFVSDRTEEVEVSLFDMMGRKYPGLISLQSENAQKFTYKLQADGLAAGNYLVQIRQGRWLASEIVVIGN